MCPISAPFDETLIVIDATDPSTAILETNLGLDIKIEIIVGEKGTVMEVKDVEGYRVYAPHSFSRIPLPPQ